MGLNLKKSKQKQKQFNYLGYIISKDRGTEQDIRYKINEAKGIFVEL